MALPVYATTGQRIGYYSFLTYCGFVFFFLIAPIFVVLPLSFSSSPFFEFTREFMSFESEAWSVRWYKQMLGICDPNEIITTVCTDKWMKGTVNSFYIGFVSTFLAKGISAQLFEILPRLTLINLSLIFWACNMPAIDFSLILEELFSLKSILEAPSKNLTSIVSTYGGTKQSFKLDFKVDDKSVNNPITVRTRATGGLSGKSLYIETSGVKVT